MLLEYGNGSGTFQILATVNTDPQERFAASFTPPGPGLYTLRAKWSGDETHMGTSSANSLTVNKAPSVIVLSSSTFNAQPCDTVKVNGYIYPATTTTFTLTYNNPSGISIIHTLPTQAPAQLQVLSRILSTFRLNRSPSDSPFHSTASS